MPSEGQTPYHRLDESRVRLAERGPSVLTTTELLGLVLGTGGAPAALEVSERLLTTYQGLVAIAQLGTLGLQQEQGIGAAKAAPIVAALELGQRLVQETRSEHKLIRGPADAAAFCLPEMGLLEQEHMRVMFLDSRNRMTGMHDVFVGTIKSIEIRIADLFREAVRRNSLGVVIAHNHPSGDPSPSTEDISTS